MEGFGGFGGVRESGLGLLCWEGNCPRLQTLMKRKCLGDFATLACIQPILHTGAKSPEVRVDTKRPGEMGGREPTNHLFDATENLRGFVELEGRIDATS